MGIVGGINLVPFRMLIDIKLVEGAKAEFEEGITTTIDWYKNSEIFRQGVTL